jgi:outer membrane protein assembly factor BamB
MSNMSVPVIPLVNVAQSTNPTLLWNYTTDNLVYSPPTINNGVLYVGSTDGNVYALNVTNGAKIWNFTTSGQVLGSPDVVDSVVYVGCAVLPPPMDLLANTTGGAVYALNATNGAQLWKYVPSGFGVSSCPDVIGRIVYVGSFDGNAYALNATSGAKLWNYTTAGAVYSSTVAGGVIYVDSSDDNLYALNATNGDRLWNCVTSGALLITWGGVLYPIWSSPVVVGGTVYVSSDNGTVCALNAESGALLWNYNTTCIEPNYQVTILSSPTIVNGELYLSSQNGNIYALNATNGVKIWNTTNGEFDTLFSTSPVVVGDVIYASSYDTLGNGTLCALNSFNGDHLWNFTIANSYYLTTSPTFFNGVVYAGCGNTVNALRVASPTPSPTTPPSTIISNTHLIIIGGLVAVIIIASIAILLLRRKPTVSASESAKLFTQITGEEQ